MKTKVFFNIDVRPTVRVMENISSKLTTYAILGLEPGESYKIELGTKTGNVPTRQSITGAAALRNLSSGNTKGEVSLYHWPPV
jgi:hypothetical protein